MILQPMASSVEIVSTGSHVAAYLLYFLNRRYWGCAVIHKKQAGSTSVSMQLLQPLLYALKYLGWGI
jgi:hypothetical protein